jgi:hypothetical protein
MKLRPRPQVSFGFLLITLLLATIPVAAQQCNSNDVGAPCFKENPDILGGRASLLQDDDLVFSTLLVNNVNTPGGVNASGGNLLTTNSAITQTSLTQIASAPNSNNTQSNVLNVKGRLFNTDHDQILSAVVVQNPSGQNSIAATLEGNSDSSIPVPALAGLAVGTQVLYGTSADFLGGGFDQMVVVAVNGLVQYNFQVLAAADPTSMANGLITGPASSPFLMSASFVLAVTSGVFTDPQPTVPRPPAQIALVSTPDGVNLQLTLYAVDSKLNVSQTGQPFPLKLPGLAFPSPIAVASGRFSGGTHDQLAIAYPVISNASTGIVTVAVNTIDFDGMGNPIQQTTTSTSMGISNGGPPASYFPAVYLAKGKFNWFGNSDQLGISLGTDGTVANNATVGVMSFDSSLNGTLGATYQAQSVCHFGLAAGRFDSMQTDPTGAQVPDFDLQLADTSSACTGESGHTATIYDVDPTTFAVTLHSSKDIGSLINATVWPVGVSSFPPSTLISLVAGDEQGRSLNLGPPEKVTIAGHTQPDTVLGLPPMHVDWITPAGAGAPQILNVSVFPTTFNTAYLFSDTTNGGVTRSGTTSYTVSTKETANEQVSYGVPGLVSVGVKASQAATQLHKNTISQKYNTYKGFNTGFTTGTTFDDVVAATSSQFNIYSYRVLGQCVPGNGPPSEGCATGTVPLYIQFSGPDNVNYISAAEGRNLEWYQPVQEPGNLFSYPATIAQLTANLGGGTGFQPLTATDTLWDSQTSAAVKTSWTQGGGNDVSAGSTSTHTFDASVSASASVTFDGFGAGIGLGFNYNQSNSVSTLNQATSSFSSSQGINLNRGIAAGGDVNNEAYDYQGQTFIYGQTAPTGTIQSDATPPTMVQAQGYITATHLVDMLSQGVITSGAFWIQAYNAAPDIALNHPQRWIQKAPSGVNAQQVQFVCPYGFTSSLSSPQCTAATPGGPAPAAIADDGFYEMKGLFVTPGGTFNGPQITNATLGSKVNLRARVYNYSLQNFPATATLHVQFYAQPWGAGQFAAGTNASTFAPAIFIGNGTTQSGDTTLPLPPAFCGGFQGSSVDPCTTSPGSTTNNWEYVYATWDTSTGGITANSAWKFWVVTWVENNGQLVSELPGHGLTSLPAANVQFNSLADVPIETYSNNLGFYNQVFTVLAAASQTNVAQSPRAANVSNRAAASPATKHLAIGNLDTRNSASVIRDVPITIVAPHLATGDHVDSIMSLYYDGDPAKGGVLFDAQHISRVLLDTPYLDTASYRATTCGQHKIFVRSVPLDGSAPVATASKTFKVTSDPVSSINDLIAYVNSPGYPPRFRNAMLSYLNAAKRSFTNKQVLAGTIQIQVLVDLVEGGALFVPSDVQRVLANQMNDLLGCL